MSSETKAEAPGLPTHILLLADCEPWRAGTVLAASVDLVARLEAEGVAYRSATKRECEIAGFAD